MLYVFWALIFLYSGRKVGWALSKGFFYPAPAMLAFAGLIIWGVMVGWVTSSLIVWQHPSVILKWVLGFALGAYVAIPNFGLFQESTIPDEVQARHALVSSVPLLSYILTELAPRFGALVKNGAALHTLGKVFAPSQATPGTSGYSHIVLAYVLAFFLAPTIASVVGFVTLPLFAAVTKRAGVILFLIRTLIAIATGAAAVLASSLIFRLFGLRLTFLMVCILFLAYLANDYRRLRHTETGPLVRMRIGDLVGDLLGIGVSASLVLASPLVS